MNRWLMPTCVLCLLACPTVARAQMGRGLGGGGRLGKGPDNKPEKPKVAEQGAPVAKPKKRAVHDDWGVNKPLQFFELNGYFRVRSDVFYQLSLGMRPLNGSAPPFPSSLPSYATGSGALCAGSDAPDLCKETALMSTNMRLRLEPTFNVHSRVRVRMTLDVFDNLVLGSTSQGSTLAGGARPISAPLGAFSDGQAVPQTGINSLADAVLVKHAWGEVDLPFGRLLFGRMPMHWGLGILANSGTCSGYARWTVHQRGDPERCTDSDHGDTVDRIMFVTTVPVLNLMVGFAWDFQATGLTTLNLSGEQVSLGSGQPFDLTPADDLQQWTVLLGRIDSPTRVRQRLANGEAVFNYGLRWVFQRQHLDSAAGSELTGELGALAGNLVERRAFVMTPDLWLRLDWRKLHLELEAVVKYGWIRDTADVSSTTTGEGNKDLEILQFGWVFRGHYRFLQDKLVVGLELGMASGDDRIEGADGQVHYGSLPQFPSGRSNQRNSLFLFDPNYRVDLIFFRELMGTVHNAGYLKPSVTYHILRDLTARLDLIYSYALEPVATPGNKPHYGVELDADLEYRWPEAGFFAGIAYGVFFPLNALDRPTDLYGTSAGFPVKGKPAHTVQLRATIKF